MSCRCSSERTTRAWRTARLCLTRRRSSRPSRKTGSKGCSATWPPSSGAGVHACSGSPDPPSCTVSVPPHAVRAQRRLSQHPPPPVRIELLCALEIVVGGRLVADRLHGHAGAVACRRHLGPGLLVGSLERTFDRGRHLAGAAEFAQRPG